MLNATLWTRFRCRICARNEEYQILPTQFYQWQKQLFEHGAATFERKNGKPRPDVRDQKIARLETKLTEKNEVVAELL